MVMTNSLRPIVRGYNQIKFHLRMEDWPQDIPLPEGAISVEMDGKPLWPYQVVYLEPDKTVETVNGWFIMPISIEQVFAWYPAEMEKRGYQEEKRSHTLPTWAWLRYHHPETDVSAEISIRCNPHLCQTRAMIQRSVIQPWSPEVEAPCALPIWPDRKSVV